LSDAAFVSFRASLFFVTAGVLAWSILDHPKVWWLVYLTHWTLAVEVLYLGFAFGGTAIAQKLFCGANDASNA